MESIPRHKKTDHVFHQGGKPVKDFQKRWARAREKAGLKDIRFHDTRHTFATWLSEPGYSPRVVMSLTGHSTIQMPARYANISDPVMAGAVEALARVSKGRGQCQEEGHRSPQAGK